MRTRLVRSIAETRRLLAEVRRLGKTIGLVPTLGALHAAHGRLIESARRECQWVAVSIFVNPLQFGPHEDYQSYPRDLAHDRAFCKARSVDLIFAPAVREMYPIQQRTFVEVTKVGDHLCGRSRPGHFRGVATVILKLLNIIQPDRAYFGEKDAQQLAVVRRMVSDLNVPVRLVEVPTVRESDGLAISSRNINLNAEQRQAAPVLYQALQAAGHQIEEGIEDSERVRQAALTVLSEQSHRVEYLEVVDPEEIQPVKRISGPVRVAGAIWIGSTRLIDNLLCHKHHRISGTEH